MDIKELIAQFDDMEAENGMNIQESEEVVNEDLLNDNIIKASENMGVQDMINMLLHIVGSYVPEKTLKTLKDQFTLALASELNKSVDETLIQDEENSNYCEFNVKIYMNGNDTTNESVKQNVEDSLERAFESADYTVEVYNV